MAYRLTRKAEADILHIYRESAEQFGTAQAEAYHARLERTFGLIALNPRLARERVEISPPVRVHPCGAHLIVYLVEESDEVLILRLRHRREDWTAVVR